MASEKKMRKVSKKNHWGRSGNWLKPGAKVRGTSFFTPGDRQIFKRQSKEIYE